MCIDLQHLGSKAYQDRPSWWKFRGSPKTPKKWYAQFRGIWNFNFFGLWIFFTKTTSTQMPTTPDKLEVISNFCIKLFEMHMGGTIYDQQYSILCFFPQLSSRRGIFASSLPFLDHSKATLTLGHRENCFQVRKFEQCWGGPLWRNFHGSGVCPLRILSWLIQMTPTSGKFHQICLKVWQSLQGRPDLGDSPAAVEFAMILFEFWSKIWL